MDRETRAELWFMGKLALCVGVPALTVAGLICGTGDYLSCHQGWARSGYRVQWKLLAGCQLSADQGHTWIPAAAYKELRSMPQPVPGVDDAR